MISVPFANANTSAGPVIDKTTVSQVTGSWVTAFGDIEVAKSLHLLRGSHFSQALLLAETRIAAGGAGNSVFEARFIAARAISKMPPDKERAQMALSYLSELEVFLPEFHDAILALRGYEERVLGAWGAAYQTWSTLMRRAQFKHHRIDAMFGLADAKYAMGELKAAQRLYSVALQEEGKSDRAAISRFNLAVIEQKLGHWPGASGGFGSIIFRTPEHVLYNDAEMFHHHLDSSGLTLPPGLAQKIGLVDKLLSARSVERAELELNKLADIELDETGARAISYRRGKLAYRQGNFNRAVAIFSQLEQGETGRWLENYLRWLARSLSALNRNHQAIQIHLRLAQTRNKKQARTALFNAAWLAYDSSDYKHAVILFDHLLKRFPRDKESTEIQWYLAWNNYHIGEYNTAIQGLERLRERVPGSTLAAQATYWQGRIFTKQGNTAKAIESFQLLQKTVPLHYYGVLAAQRLAELTGSMEKRSKLFSALQTVPKQVVARPFVTHQVVLESDTVSDAPSLFEQDNIWSGKGRELLYFSPIDQPIIPWASAALDWESEAGKRAILYISYGLFRDGATLVGKVPAAAGMDRKEVFFARARLLYTMGDFSSAYRTILRSVPWKDLQNLPTANNLAHFQLAFPLAHRDLVLAAGREFSVSPLVILSIMRQESAYDDQARSWASANGLLQIIPRTGKRIAQRLGIKDYNIGFLRTAKTNVRFGTWYLAELVKRFGGNLPLAIGSYNAGPVAMGRWVSHRAGGDLDEFIENIPYKETRRYVKRVLSHLAKYNYLYRGAPFEIPLTVPTFQLDNVNF